MIRQSYVNIRVPNVSGKTSTRHLCFGSDRRFFSATGILLRNPERTAEKHSTSVCVCVYNKYDL